MSACPHDNLVPEPCDQTLGVACNDCNLVLGVCWMDHHVSESIWNRAVANVQARGVEEFADCKPCAESREDVCFLCGWRFTP